MATVKGDWNLISHVYKSIFSTLITESRDIDYWVATGSFNSETTIQPSGWDDESGVNPQTIEGVEWTKHTNVGNLKYIKTFQSRFYPVRGGEMEHNSLYPFVFLTFIEQGGDTLHSHPNVIETLTDLGIVIMQYNDGDVNLQGEKFFYDKEFTSSELGYSSNSNESFIKNTQKGIVEIIEDVKSLLYNKHKLTGFGLKNVDWQFNGVTDPTLTSLQPLLLSPYIEAKQINLRITTIENRNANQLGD